MRKRNPYKVTALAAAISAGTALSIPGYALDFSAGDVEIGLDTNLSIGAGWRASDIDYEGVGPVNGGAHRHNTGSQDNSNLRYKEGATFTEIITGTIDLEATYEDYGLFTRGRFWYDSVIVDGDGGNTLPEYYATDASGHPTEPDQSEGRGGKILDAFVWGNWYINESMPLNVRLGQQVISWGESVFFPNSINSINPIDVNALLAPGASIKEALIPVKALYGSIGANENLSFEAFYQFEWEKTIIPGCGTFYNTTDLVGEGCNDGFYAFGADAGASVTNAVGLPTQAADVRLPRGADIDPSDSGQFGFAMRYFIEPIETEVGVFAMQYHSRLPLLSGYTPKVDNFNLLGTLFNFENLPMDDIRSQMQIAVNAGLNGLNAAGQIPNPAGIPFSTALATANLLPYAQYVVEYPEDIKLLGVSFSTTIDFGLPGGASSVSGEFSVRKDQPFQIEDGVLLAGLIGLPSQLCADSPVAFDCFAQFGQGEYIPGYIQEDYYQAEVAVIHFFDQILWANRWTVVFDVAASYADIPDNDELLLNSSYNAALNTAWNAQTDDVILQTLFSLQPFEDQYYPTKAAWGYKTRFSGEYNNIFGGINMIPTISFSHDVNGVTPGPITNFLENRKSLGLTFEFVYQNMYSLKVGYTNFFGAEPYNQLADRDNYSLSASVSF